MKKQNVDRQSSIGENDKEGAKSEGRGRSVSSNVLAVPGWSCASKHAIAASPK